MITLVLKIPRWASRTFHKSPKSNLFVLPPTMLHWNTWKKCIQEAGLAETGNNNPKVKSNIPQEKLDSPDWPFKDAVNETYWRVCSVLMEQVSENQWKSFVCNYRAERSFRQSVYQYACPVYKVVYSQTRSWSVLEKHSDELIKKLCVSAGIWFNLVEHQKLPVGSTISYMHGLLNCMMQNMNLIDVKWIIIFCLCILGTIQ